MKMKKLITLSILFFLTFNSFSQHKENEERIKALKIAFITERLALTESEAQKFWPIYNSFEDKNNTLRRKAHNRPKSEDFDAMTEQDAKNLINEMISVENQRSELRQKYMQDLLTVLPAKKVIQLKIAEDALKCQTSNF